MGSKKIRVRFKDLTSEEGAQELAASENIKPYIALLGAAMKNEDIQPFLEVIRAIPLEDRYVWRVASALKWGFADFDSMSIAADRVTLSPEDWQEIDLTLQIRPLQFCLFLKALIGPEAMKRTMQEAIAHATVSPEDLQ